MSMETTATILRALAIFRDAGGTLSIEQFGRRFFPTSPHWRRDVGKALKASAGQCGRIRARGLLDQIARGIYRITERGAQFLAYNGAPPRAPTAPAPVPPLPQSPYPWPAYGPMPAQPPFPPYFAPAPIPPYAPAPTYNAPPPYAPPPVPPYAQIGRAHV